MQHAVDAKADRAHLAPRLQVDVAGALVEGVLPQPIDHLHDTLVIGVERLVVLAEFDQLLEARQRVGLAGLDAFLIERASVKNSVVYLAISVGWATTRRSFFLVWPSISLTQALSSGSQVATVTSCNATDTGSARFDSA